MIVLRYPLKALVGDYIRAGVGLAVGLGVLASVPASPAIVIIFGGISALFGVFGLRTVKRQATEISLDEAGIRTKGIGMGMGDASLPWSALETFKLRYYGTRRQRTRGEGEGFMQLTLKGGGASLTLESSLEGFNYIAWRAAKAARDQGIPLDPTSAGNLLDIGIDADVEQEPPMPRTPQS